VLKWRAAGEDYIIIESFVTCTLHQIFIR